LNALNRKAATEIAAFFVNEDSMKKIAVIFMLLLGSLAFAQDANSNDPTQGQDPAEQKMQQQKMEQKKPNAQQSTYHSPYESDISKSSFGAAKGSFTQNSVTNASPQHAAGAPVPTIDFHHKNTSHSSTGHDPKADAKAKASYDPGEYKAKAPAKLPQ
jgi:hypothetical protein